jgi:hypothetical protein
MITRKDSRKVTARELGKDPAKMLALWILQVNSESKTCPESGMLIDGESWNEAVELASEILSPPAKKGKS